MQYQTNYARSAEDFFESAKRAAQDNMVRDGHLVPMVTILLKDTRAAAGNPSLEFAFLPFDGNMMESGQYKDGIVMMVEQVMENFSRVGKLPIALTMTSEAWFWAAEYKKGESIDDMKAKTKKQEIIFVTCETEFEQKLYNWIVDRAGNGRVTLKKGMGLNSDVAHSFSGRFVHLFKKFKVNQNSKAN